MKADRDTPIVPDQHARPCDEPTKRSDESDRATLEAIRQGLEEIEAGLGRPADEVFNEIRREFEISREA